MEKLLNKILYPFLEKIFSKLPLKNIIFMESWPVYTDNTKYVFDEMIRQGINKRYKIYWNIFHFDTSSINESEKLKQILEQHKNVYLINALTRNTVHDVLSTIKRLYVLNVAKVYVIGNHHIPKKRNKQVYINLTHGAPLKCIKNHGYGAPVWTDYVVRLSDIFEENLQEPEKNKAKYVTLGYPRNDELFKEKIDLHNVFENRVFEKVIYWMPTWRQHNSNGKSITSSSSIPIIHDVDKAIAVNEFAKNNNILIVLKPHFAQDISKFNEIDMSNIIFITNDFLAEKNILNYELMRSVDALLTDYSSVYYDFLLCDKPIGLCWEDFDEFNENEGFVFDVNEILSGGEKIYTVDDMRGFIDRVAKGEDLLVDNRHTNRALTHKYVDDKSSKRVVDFIVSIL